MKCIATRIQSSLSVIDNTYGFTKSSKPGLRSLFKAVENSLKVTDMSGWMGQAKGGFM